VLADRPDRVVPADHDVAGGRAGEQRLHPRELSFAAELACTAPGARQHGTWALGREPRVVCLWQQEGSAARRGAHASGRCALCGLGVNATILPRGTRRRVRTAIVHDGGINHDELQRAFVLDHPTSKPHSAKPAGEQAKRKGTGWGGSGRPWAARTWMVAPPPPGMGSVQE
jgi:hypothetical protein